MCVSNGRKLIKLKSKYNKFMNGLSEGNIDAVLENSIDKLNIITEKNRELEYKVNALERNLYYCIQKVGMVRFNGFDNVGSDLSYSIALLDNNEDGIVISSLYSRESSSTFAKPVQGGKSKYPLSVEEVKAIDLAKKTTSLSRNLE